jgi:hypothetical protein
VIGGWKPARNAKPQSSEDLEKALAKHEAQAGELTAEVQVIQGDIPNLIGTPRYAEAQSRLAKLETDLIVSRRTIDGIKDGIAKAKAREAAEREAAKEAQKRAEVERYDKEAKKVFAPLTVEILRDCAALKAKIAKLVAHVEQAGDFQRLARELGVPVPSDGELLIRGIPARDIPAVTRIERAWVNANNERPGQLVERNGKMVPVDTGFGPQGPFEERDVEVIAAAARHEPAKMPERLSALAERLERALA